jgi:hypothetical protein
VQNAALLVAPVPRHVLAWVAECIGTLHPYLLAFQRALELLEHAEFVVSAVDPVFTLDLLEDLLPPSGSDHTFDRNRLRKIPFRVFSSIWEHVNPYGRFDVDMNARLALL